MVDKAQEKIKKDIIKKMKEVGTYNVSFIYTINVLAKVLMDYETTTEQFAKTGGSIVIKHTNKNGSTNIVKNPLYLALEKLRDDTIAYSRELGLTPAGLKRINQDGNKPEKKSKLEQILSDFK
jgi:DNA-dependent RNA polymerase auxiliary subunit epsilon